MQGQKAAARPGDESEVQLPRKKVSLGKLTSAAVAEATEERVGPITFAVGAHREVFGIGVGCNLHSLVSLHESISAVAREEIIEKNKH
jgi:hypothetical protein